jgi:hypothetical protein
MPTLDIGDQAIHGVDRGAGEALVIFADDLQAAGAYDEEMAHLADRFHVLAVGSPVEGVGTRTPRAGRGPLFP